MEQQGPINCLLTDILQNIFSCVQQKKETHTGLKHLNILHLNKNKIKIAGSTYDILDLITEFNE